MIPISCFSLVVRFKDKAKFSNLVLYIFVCVYGNLSFSPLALTNAMFLPASIIVNLVHGHEYVVKILIN